MVDDLVSIGRFAAGTRLSIKALRHYHDVGLLVPAVVDPSSGYRYYRLGQANRAEAIRTLRSLDVPLDDIRVVLEGDEDEAASLLRRHQQRLADELARHARMLGYVHRLISGEEQLMPYAIETATLPTQPVASLRRTTGLDRIGDDLAEAFGALHGAVTSAGLAIVGAPLVRYHDLIDEETDGTIEVCVPVASADVHLDGVEVCTLPETTTARTIHQGPYDELRPAYHALFAWIHEHGHEPAGPPQETYLNDPTEVSEEEQLTQVDVPVR